MKQPLVKTVDLERKFQMDGVCITALEKINLNIYEGEFVSITGPSGSGKSTLMHILGCLDKPTAGQLFLEGQEVSKLNPNQLAQIRNQKIGFIFQAFNLLPRTSALENVEMPLIYAGVTASRRYQVARQKLIQLGLEDRLEHHPNQLSGGQQQRVAIARALVNNPKIILADEPTGNLDSKSGQEIIKILHDLHRQKHTIILVTHDLDLAREAGREIKLIDGRIVSETKRKK
jgi:putative ABC transport system ATP-binding protein